MTAFSAVRPSAIKLKSAVRFPARVEGGTAISVEKENGVYTINLDYSGLQETDTFDPDVVEVAVWDPVADDWRRVSLTDFLNVSLTPAAFDAIAPTTTRGDLIARGASANERLAIGTSGYALLSNGTDPAWSGFLQSGTGAVTRTWQEELRQTVRPEQFRSVIDADWTNAIDRAVAALQAGNGGVVEFGADDYDISAQIRITQTKPIVLAGAGRGATIIRQTNATAHGLFFEYSVLSSGGGVCNLTIEAGDGYETAADAGTGSTGTGLRVDRANDNFSTLGVSINNFGTSLALNGCWNTHHMDGRVLFAENDGILIGGDAGISVAGGNKFVNWKVSNLGFTGTNSGSSGVRIRQSGGDFFSHMDITSFNTGVKVDPAAAKQVAYCFFTAVLADTCDEDGWVIDGSAGTVTSLETNNCWGSFCGRYGLRTLGANLDSMTNIGIRLRENGQHGWSHEGGKNIRLHAPEIAQNSQDTTNTYDGVNVAAGVDEWAIIGGRIGNFASGLSNGQRYGLSIASGASDNVQVTGCDLRGNVTGPLLNGNSSSLTVYSGNLPKQTASLNKDEAYSLISTATGTVAAGSTSYLGPNGQNAAEGLASFVIPKLGIVYQVLVQVDTAPGVGQTFTYTVRKNNVDTSMTGAISGSGSFQVVIATNNVSFSGGDVLTLKLVTSAGAAAANHRASILIEP